MNKSVYIILTVSLVASIGILLVGSTGSRDDGVAEALPNVEMRDGVQYVTVNAKGGYSPRVSSASAGIPTKLVVKTNGTFDCSAALVVRSVGFQKILAQTGEEVIDLGTPKAGETIQGVCGMGMYSFKIDFI